MILNILISLIAFIIILSIVVFIHEFGHYILAIKNGVQVDEFAIGYGKEIYGWNDKRGTRWKICLLPFGGFVKFFADEDESSSMTDREKLMAMNDEDKKKCLYFKTVWQRIQVVSAGPIFNYFLAIVFFTVYFAFAGVVHISNKIGSLETNSPAELSGILAGDKVVKINNEKIEYFEDIKKVLSTIKINAENKTQINLVIERNGETLEKTVEPVVKQENNENITFLGVISTDEIIKEKVGVVSAFSKSIKFTWFISSTTLKALGQMITGKKGFDDVGGPIKIAQYSGKFMKEGVLAMIYFIALISTSLGLMNLLPIPVLDGGHIFLYIIEAIRKKPLNEKIENNLTKFFYYLLILLMVIVTIKDVLGIF